MNFTKGNYKTIMKRKIIARSIAVALSAVLFFAQLPINSYAVETVAEATDEADGEADNLVSIQNDVSDEEYYYLDSSMRDSFGQVSKDAYLDYHKVAFQNVGSQTHFFTLTCTDADMWEIVNPSKNTIAPGEIIYVSVKPNLSSSKYGTGDYASALYMHAYDKDNCEITASISVNLYVSVYEKAKPWVNSVTVYPSEASLGKGTSYRFGASVDCGGGATDAVNWSINGNNSGSTTISSSGVINIASDETSSNIQVVATSVQDNSYRATANVSIAKSQVTIAAQAQPTNGGVVTGGGNYNEGDSVTLVASSANNFSFSGWYDQNNNLVNSSPQYRFTVGKNNYNVYARFTQNSVRVTTKKNIDQGGTISDSAYVATGNEYTLKATPNKNYTFVGWYEGNNKISDSNITTVRGITSNREFTAVFAQSAYDISIIASPTNGGKVSGAGTYNKGSDAKLTAEPANGFVFVGWLYNNSIISTDKNFVFRSIDRDYSLTAIFQQQNVQTFTITSSTNNGNGTISPFGSVKIEKGKNVVYAISPNQDYHIKDVVVDGKSVGAVTTYTFYDLNADHTIVANFEKNATTAAQSQKNKDTTNSSTGKNTNNTNTTQKQSNATVQDEKTKVTTTEPTTDVVVVAEDVETPDVTTLTGTYQDLNITEQEAIAMIDGGDDRSLMENALYRGDLEVIVRNLYADVMTESAVKSYYELESTPNFSEVIDSVLSKEEKLALFAGAKVRANLTVCSLENEIEPTDKYLFEQNVGNNVTIGTYFDVRLIVENDGVPKLVTTLDKPMTVVVKVTPEMRNSGRECLVMRLHNGSFDILPDEDNNPDTITFSTDKMSVFAMGYYNIGAQNGINNQTNTQELPHEINTENVNSSKKNNDNVVIYVLIGVIIAGVGTVLGILLSSGSKKKKRHRRK